MPNHFVMRNIEKVGDKFLARYFVGSRMGERLCDSREEAGEFLTNGIRSELGFGPLTKIGLEN